MKKILAVILSVCLAAALAACSKKTVDVSDEPSANISSQSTETRPPEAKPSQPTLGKLLFGPGCVYAVKDDEIYAWGENDGANFFPERPDRSNSGYITAFVKVASDLPAIKQIVMGPSCYLLLSENGDVYIYDPYSGYDYFEQKEIKPVTIEKLIGLSKIESLSPLPYFPPDSETTADMSRSITYAIAGNGDLFAIEREFARENNVDSFSVSFSPISVKLIADAPKVTKILPNDGALVLLAPTGEVYTIGDNEDGKLGDGTDVEFSSDYVRVKDLSNVVDITGDNYGAAYALTTDGKVYAWGNNYRGQLGVGGGDESFSNIPVDMGFSNIKAIYSAFMYEHSSAGLLVAVADNGAVYAPPIWEGEGWRYNGYVQAPGVNNPKDVLVYENENLYFLLDDGSVYAYGNDEYGNKYGQLGNGSTAATKSRVKIEGLPPIVAIYSRSGSVFAVDENGAIYAWGYNEDGLLGIGKAREDYPSHTSEGGYEVYDAYEPSPVKIDGLTLLNK